MRVNLSIKNKMYEELEIIAKSQNRTISSLLREWLEQDVVRQTIHEMAIYTQSLDLPSDIAASTPRLTVK